MNNRRKSILTNCILTLGICLLIISKISLPEYYDSLYDNTLENKVTYEDAELMAYEADYGSFYDKLYAVALCKNKGIVLKGLKITEYESGITDEKLTDIVMKEIKKCIEVNIITPKARVSEDELITRELCTLYAVKGNKEFNSINFYKVVYKKEDCDMTLYIDSEYHKIYDMRFDMRDNKHSVYTYIHKIKEYDKYVNVFDETGNIQYSGVYEESFYMRNEYMLSYLGLEECTWVYPYEQAVDSTSIIIDRDEKNYCIIADMGDNCTISIAQREWIDADKKEHWEIGTGIKEYIE